MPVTCTLRDCTSSSKQGIKMNRFPRDPVRRNKWITNCKLFGGMLRPPNNYSLLCELHFSPEMWEKVRVDGKKKLRHNAIPTIFGGVLYEVIDESYDESPAKPETNNCSRSEDEYVSENDINEENVVRQPETNSASVDVRMGELKAALNDEGNVLIIEENFVITDDRSVLKEKLEYFKTMYNNSEKLRNEMMNMYEKKLTSLREEIEYLQHVTKNISNILTDEQIIMLQNNSRTEKMVK